MTDVRKLGMTFLRVLSAAVAAAIMLFGLVLLFMFMATVDYLWEWPIAVLFFIALVGPVVFLLLRFAIREPHQSELLSASLSFPSALFFFSAFSASSVLKISLTIYGCQAHARPRPHVRHLC